MRATAPIRPEKVEQIKTIVEQNSELTVNGKILMVLSTVNEPSIYELTYGFYPYNKQYRKGSGVEKFLEDAAEKIHKTFYTRLMRHNLLQFRKSEMGQYFVLRATVLDNQWLLKIFRTEQEYKDKQIDDRLDSVANGIRQLKKRDHSILAIPETERKKLIQEQIQQQRRKLKVGK